MAGQIGYWQRRSTRYRLLRVAELSGAVLVVAAAVSCGQAGKPTGSPAPETTRESPPATLAPASPVSSPPGVAVTSPTPSPPSEPAAPAGSPVLATTLRFASLTSPVKRGEQATLEVLTTPGAACTVTFSGPGGPSGSPLPQAIADSNGRANWSWTVAANTPPGRGTVSVKCSFLLAAAPIEVQ